MNSPLFLINPNGGWCPLRSEREFGNLEGLIWIGTYDLHIKMPLEDGPTD